GGAQRAEMIAGSNRKIIVQGNIQRQRQIHYQIEQARRPAMHMMKMNTAKAQGTQRFAPTIGVLVKPTQRPHWQSWHWKALRQARQLHLYPPFALAAQYQYTGFAR